MRFIFISVGLAFTLSLVACNTVQGMGRDIERGGESIQKASK